MAFNRPALADLRRRIQADFVSRLELKGGILRRSVVGVLSTVLELLRIRKDIRFTADYVPAGEGDCADLRNAIHPKPSRRTPGYEFTAKPYRQTFSDRFPFVPDLSILDLLFCCGTDACDKL